MEGHTKVNLSGFSELASVKGVNILKAHMQDIQDLPVGVGLFHETERYRPKPTETGSKNANRGSINYIYTIV